MHLRDYKDVIQVNKDVLVAHVLEDVIDQILIDHRGITGGATQHHRIFKPDGTVGAAEIKFGEYSHPLEQFEGRMRSEAEGDGS